MSKYSREEDGWQNVRRMLLEALGEPSDEDVRAVREGVRSRIAGQQKSGRRWWIWNAAAAAVCVAAILALMDVRVTTRQNRPIVVKLVSLSSPVIAPRELAEVWLPVRPHVRRPRLSAGIRSVVWTTAGDGSSQLKLTTADPNVVILLPLDKAGEEHEN